MGTDRRHRRGLPADIGVDTGVSVRFLSVALVVVAVALAACGGGGGDKTTVRATTCPLDDPHTPAGSQALPWVSLDEARQRSQFELVLPEYLPEGVAVEGVRLWPNVFCPNQQIREAVILFRGAGYWFTITEVGGGVEFGGGSPSEPIDVNGVKGQMSVRTTPGVPRLKAVYWTQGDLGFIGEPVRYGPLTEEEFLQILESIPE